MLEHLLDYLFERIVGFPPYSVKDFVCRAFQVGDLIGAIVGLRYLNKNLLVSRIDSNLLETLALPLNANVNELEGLRN